LEKRIVSVMMTLAILITSVFACNWSLPFYRVSGMSPLVRNINTGLNYTAIQAAIDAPETLDGHTLVCDPGNYTEFVDVNKSLNIIGAGPEVCRIIPPADLDDDIDILDVAVNITGFTIVTPALGSGYFAVLIKGVGNCNLWNNVISGPGMGIDIRDSSWNVVSNCTLDCREEGITVSDLSWHNRIVGNCFVRNYIGVKITNASNYNIVERNFIEGDSITTVCGIHLSWVMAAGVHAVEYNKIENNFVRKFVGYGILLDWWTNHTLVSNNLITNNVRGIWLRESYNNTITSNSIISNTDGMGLEASYSNVIYDNFLNNTNNAWDNGANAWNVLDESLVGYWSLDEGSGTTAHDLSGNGNHGTIYGATWTTGKYGKALSFDGINDYVEVSDSYSLKPSLEITVSMWVLVKNASAVDVQHMISKSQNTSESGRSWEMLTRYWGVYQSWIYNTAGGREYLAVPIPDYTTFHFFTFTYDGSRISLYVDDQLKQSKSFTGQIRNFNTPLYIGGKVWNYFTGTIDDVCIYNRALDSKEVRKLYEFGAIKRQEMNILGQPFVGGNYWGDALNLTDFDGDGISDGNEYFIYGGSNIDRLPLVQSYIKVFPLEYDPATQTGRIRYEISPTGFYRSKLEANETVFDQIDLPPKSYYEEADYGIPSDPMIGYTTNVSEPKIPVIKLCCAIPPDMEPEPIPPPDPEVECVGVIEDTLIVPVETYEVPIEPPKYVMNTAVYSSTDLYPAGWVSQPRNGSLYGFKTFNVDLHPVRYIPSSRTVYLYKIKGSIPLKGAFNGRIPPETSPFESTLRRFISNYYEGKKWHSRPYNTNQFPILIISADDFYSQALDLANWKTNDRPYQRSNTKVETVSTVITGLSGSIPDRIRQFIYDYVSSHGTQFVILLGDVSMTGVSESPDWPLQAFPLGTDTDHYYCAQALPTEIRGVVAVSLRLRRVGSPYLLKVLIREGLDGPNKADFAIDHTEVGTSWTWICRHLDHVELDNTKTYYLVLYESSIDPNNYWEVCLANDYQPGHFYRRWGFTGPWDAWATNDMVHRIQLYTDISVPTLYAKNSKPWIPPDDAATPCDYYYACVDPLDTWDPNNNCWYADSNEWGSIDFQPDAAVGRLPADSSTEANTMVQRIKAYENTWGQFCPRGSAIVPFERPTHYTTCSNTYWNFEAYCSDLKSLFNKKLGPSHWCWETSTQPPCGDPDIDRFVNEFNEFNQGIDAVHLAGHGCYPYIKDTREAYFDLYNVECDVPNHDHSRGFGADQVQNNLIQTTHFPVVFAFSCDTAHFDLNPEQYPVSWWTHCLAEAFLVTGKASSYIGCVRESWGFAKDHFDYVFWNAYTTSWRTGIALNEAKLFAFSQASLNNPSDEAMHTLLTYHLFGDPETNHYRSHWTCQVDPCSMLTIKRPPCTEVECVNFGENVTVVFKNIFNFTVYLPNTAPWEIADPYGNMVYKPLAYQVITPIAPGQNISWTWNQTILNGSLVNIPGKYWFRLYTLNFTKQRPFYILSPDAWVFTAKSSYNFGEPMTVGFRNMGNKTLTLDLTVRRGGRTVHKICAPGPGPDLDFDDDIPPLEIEEETPYTGHLTPPGEYILTANATDPEGKTYTYTTKFTVTPTPPYKSTITARTATHDTSTINIKPHKTVVAQGYSVNINVTIENAGAYTETTNITTYANTTPITTITGVSLTSATQKTITITWNTSGFAKGNYAITAYAHPVPGETDTTDNTHTDGWIIIAMLGDLTGPEGVPEGKVDMRDVYLVARAFGSYPSHPRWNPNADINNDGKVDMRDIYVVARNFGKTDP